MAPLAPDTANLLYCPCLIAGMHYSTRLITDATGFSFAMQYYRTGNSIDLVWLVGKSKQFEKQYEFTWLNPTICV